MFFALPLVLMLFVAADVSVFRKVDAAKAARAFRVPPLYAVIFLAFGYCAFTAPEDGYRQIVVIMIAFALSLYFLRRQFLLSILPALEQPVRIYSGAIGVTLHWLYGVVVISLMMHVLGLLFPKIFSELAEAIYVAVSTSILALVLIRNETRCFSDKGFFYNVGFDKSRHHFWRVSAWPVILGLFFAMVSSWILVHRDVQPNTPMNDILQSADSVGLVILFLCVAILFAPFVEEVMFRGYYFHIVRLWKGERFAIFFIGVLFGVLHYQQYWGDWMAMAIVTVLGITLTLLRAVSGSTLASVVMHYVYNAGVTIIPVIMLVAQNPAFFKYQALHETLTSEGKIELLRDAVVKQPDLDTAYYELAKIYMNDRKDPEVAAEYIEYALTYDADNPEYLELKAEITERLSR